MAQADKRKKDPELTSPIGTFRYPKITEIDYGTKDYPKPDGEYSIQLLLPKGDKITQAFLAQIKPLHDAAIAEGNDLFAALPIATRKKLGALKANPFYDEVYDKDTEKPTGDIVLKIKLKASGVYKKGPNAGKTWNAKPIVYDSKGHRLVDVPDIWGGTRGRVAFSVGTYFVAGQGMAGVSLRLIGAKIITLVSKGERTADSLGFGDDEDGYETDGASLASSSTNSHADIDTSEDADTISF